MTIEEKRAEIIALEQQLKEDISQERWVRLFNRYETLARDYMAELDAKAVELAAQRMALESTMDDYQAAQVDRVDSMPREDDGNPSA